MGGLAVFSYFTYVFLLWLTDLYSFWFKIGLIPPTAQNKELIFIGFRAIKSKIVFNWSIFEIKQFNWLKIIGLVKGWELTARKINDDFLMTLFRVIMTHFLLAYFSIRKNITNMLFFFNILLI